ncbi:MAG: hypothetical protein ACREVC_04205 [Burkholderiales bacterium]
MGLTRDLGPPWRIPLLLLAFVSLFADMGAGLARLGWPLPVADLAVLRVAVPYSRYFYAPLALLHASLVIRLARDWMALSHWRAWGGALNGLALLAFVLATIAAVIAGAARSHARSLTFEEQK